MKKMIAMIMMMVIVMSNVAFAATPSTNSALGEYEKSAILDGTYEVVTLKEGHKAAFNKWSDPDLFGNQYRLYAYNEEGELKIVALKHHTTKAERKALKEAKK